MGLAGVRGEAHPLGFAAFKSHLNFAPTPSALKPFRKELANYKTGKGTISFPYDEPLPKALIRSIAGYRERPRA